MTDQDPKRDAPQLRRANPDFDEVVRAGCADDPTRTPARVRYRRQLEGIDDEFIAAAARVCAAIPTISTAFLNADRDCVPAARDMSTQVIHRVADIENSGFLLLAREAPVASDLRRLVSILRLVTAVERSATLLCHVAETIERVDPRHFPAHAHDLASELGQRAGDVFRRGVHAWSNRDGLATGELDQQDAVVDVLAVDLLRSAHHVTNSADAMAIAQLARYWERIADHGVSFAQHSTFAVTGDRVVIGN